MDFLSYNQKSWDQLVASKNRWTVPVSEAAIERARMGNWSVVLTPEKPVPRDWFPPMKDCDVLGLASAGGQQCALFAAAGARVTVFDLSPAQLEQDRKVATHHNLAVATVQGDMRDLSALANESFDLVFHPCSNCYVDRVRPVWKECFRVLRSGGLLLAGMTNPIVFAIDPEANEKGRCELKYKIPYSDLTSLSDEERKRYTDQGEPLAFGHTLGDLIGGQLEAGFQLTGFYEDRWHDSGDLINQFTDCYLATRALKPRLP